MFKCKECGTEYQVKPDYCDCGNDTFEETITATPETEVKKEEYKQAEIKQNIPTEKQNDITVQETAKPVVKKVSAIEPYAIIIFSICILLSLAVILFVANPKPQTGTEEKEIQETNTVNIPSIEKLWNNSTEGISAYQNGNKSETKKTEEPKQQVTKEPQKEETAKKKVEVIQQPTKQIRKSKSTITTKETTKPQQTTNDIKPSTTINKAPATPKANPQELANYKIKLRNYIASKISFTSIVGDGECSFSFKISSGGALTNKAPVNLSDNESLNEAVYNALRQIYSYNTPPSGYKNETLKLTVRMYNNSFEVYLQ